MGLGQVRDLRRASVRALIAERRARPFSSIGDLLKRVQLGRKECTHLIQAGALDGLGASRAALLSEAGTANSGDGGQLAFAFALQVVAAEDAAQRMAWETRLLGMPVSLHPLATVAKAREGALSLADLNRSGGAAVTVVGTRLPGWTGGKGWFFGDELNYVVAIPPKGLGNPRPWRPIRLRGRWRRDEWGDSWLQVEEWQLLE
jgi:hypothetical protein